MKPISLVELVHYAGQHSEFYRKFWKQHGFDPSKHFRGREDLGKIPILTKEGLLSVSIKNRSTLRAEDRYYFTAISSGTTRRPLISLQSSFAMPPYYRFAEGLARNPASSILILRPASHAAAFIGAGLPAKYFRPGSILSVGDTSDLIFSAHIATEIEADCLVIRPSDAVRFALVLEEQGYSPFRITFLWITGEPLTAAAMALLKRLYPSALILYVYAMTEGPDAMGTKSSLCADLDALSPGAYHLNVQDFIFEAVNGSSVVTALHRIPTPIIRYHTGDRIIIKEDFRCSCGFPKGPIGIVGPRAGESSYKIGGYTFQAEAIRDALRKLPGLVADDFALEIEQAVEGDRLVGLLRLIVRPVGGLTPFLKDTIRETLEREVYVTRSRLLGEAVRQNSIRLAEIGSDAALRGGRILPPREIMKPFLDGAKHMPERPEMKV